MYIYFLINIQIESFNIQSQPRSFKIQLVNRVHHTHHQRAEYSRCTKQNQSVQNICYAQCIHSFYMLLTKAAFTQDTSSMKATLWFPICVNINIKER